MLFYTYMYVGSKNTFCLKGVPGPDVHDPEEKRRFKSQTLSQNNRLKIAAIIWQIKRKQFRLCQIILFLVYTSIQLKSISSVYH